MKKLLPAFSLLLVLVAFTSCKTKKPTAPGEVKSLKTTEIKQVGAAMDANRFDFEFMTIRAKGVFEGMGVRQNITLHIRMERNKQLWISAQALLGIEVARIYVTQDSLFFRQNLPESKYAAMPLDSIERYLAMPLSVGQLQDFFIGNPLLPYTNAQSDWKGDTIVVEKPAGKAIVTEYIMPNLVKIVRSTAQSRTEASNAQVSYGEFQVLGTKSLPSKVNIFVSSPEVQGNFALHYGTISTDPISNFPFTREN
ncbi:MAG: DUF4292 domain-containing protein [Bacteroidetes bacterium]|nr:MAG: DUF4292 domain-containing protein [Bacteroidota bacterium]